MTLGELWSFLLQVAVHLLSIAIAYKTPIIFVRESGYRLPQELPEDVITYICPPESAPFTPGTHEVRSGVCFIMSFFTLTP